MSEIANADDRKAEVIRHDRPRRVAVFPLSARAAQMVERTWSLFNSVICIGVNSSPRILAHSSWAAADAGRRRAVGCGQAASVAGEGGAGA
jgi:hypothetical protein